MNLFTLSLSLFSWMLTKMNYAPPEFPVHNPSNSVSVTSLAYIWSINLFLKKKSRLGKKCRLSFELPLVFNVSIFIIARLDIRGLAAFLCPGIYTWFACYSLIIISYTSVFFLPIPLQKRQGSLCSLWKSFPFLVSSVHLHCLRRQLQYLRMISFHGLDALGWYFCLLQNRLHVVDIPNVPNLASSFL